MESRPSLNLIDNTSPNRRLSDDEGLSEITTADDLSRNTSRRWKKPSVRRELTKRKYKKWQPKNLGITDDDDADRRPSDARLSLTATYTNTEGESLADISTLPTSEQRDFGAADQENGGPGSVTGHGVSGLKPGTELDILYENQRGWFFFGIPLYSHGSLLNFDPAAWVTYDFRDSPVNITNAQVPDPSWEWAWKTWFVDMSGDVDDQGWQYSFSFSSSAWHGSHPWFHSFVRRRRWVRLRVKKASERSRRGRSGFEMAHMLNEDYFTIHTAKKKRAASAGRGSQGPSTHLSRATTTVDEEGPLEEIGNIPTLMSALRNAKIDREKFDILRRFVADGGQELYYLDGKMQDIMALFVFQASRWQLVTHLTGIIEELSGKEPESSGMDAEETRRQKDYLTKAVTTAKRYLTGPEILASEGRVPAREMSEMLDLTPEAKRENSVAAGPDEPLLFLYPRWFTAAVRQRRSISSIKCTSKCTARLCNAGGFVPGTRRRLSLGGSTKRWASSSNAAKTDVIEEAGSSQQNDQATTTPDGGQDGWTGGEVNRDGVSPPKNATSSKPSLPDSTEKSKLHEDRRKRLFNIFADIDSKPPRPTPPPPPKSNAPRARDLKTHTRPLAAPPKMHSHERARATMKSLSVRDRRKLRCRLFFTKRMNPEAKWRWTLWTKLEELFERMEQNNTVWRKRGIKHKEMLLPEETVALLAGATDMAMKENVWYVPMHNGCKVHVLHPRESEGQYRKVVLSGSERVVELVGDRIAHAKSLQEMGDPLIDIRKPPIPVFPSMETMARKNIPVPIIRGVWDFYKSAKDPANLGTLLPLSQNLSSVREFAEHVDEVARSSPSYKAAPGSSHQKQVAKSLLALFQNERYHGFLSTAALNTALSFLLDHEFVKYARMIFLRAEHVVTVDSFNILLKFAAQKQDMRLFRQFLLTMPRLNIRPNPYTWLTFLDCLVSPKAKANLVSRMMQKGYLNESSAMRTALQVTIQNTFHAHLKSGKSVDSFFNMLIDTQGANWFPPSLINQMLNVAARQKDFSAMERILQICKQQGFAVKGSTVNQIVLLFRKDIFSLLRVLFQFIDRPERVLTKDAWEKLFLVAFKGRHYNICRVLWRYACMYRGVTYNMRQSVLTSLLRNTSFRKTGGQYNQLWLTSAGKVIVGVDLHLPNYPLDESFSELVPSEFSRNPVASLATGFKPTGGEREKQQILASKLILRDTEVGPMYRPSKSLNIMLEAAAVLDQEWKSVPRPTQWLMQNAIKVSVKRKSDYLQ
ncbi:hypothetical protein ANOM_008431 [Aspergillus nomiae NRRL 13137]|uniref:Peroxin/Ferlin domain-containing protein n=1 Tax=Aspergillus nomiae NRRL (strain ATCC 15546 / NRRL 13137 / CBS 260.88 / M93) TaxID=1509407 RepID=A0A0L1IXZ4_ASPN3|nr:uncharacterized protein ANOM_008431 [Aspergillus nomiae NRRL 13137]KNG84285.1 hypothetical protein ANOM_008431 [Aspergillus nomiae NRRL 13137]